MRKLYSILLIISSLCIACTTNIQEKPRQSENYKGLVAAKDDQALTDQKLIEKYLQENNLQAESTTSGLYYIIQQEGLKEIPLGATVKVDYKGQLLNGQVFDSSYERGEALSISLNNVIKGWQEGLPLLKVGGAGKLLVPSKLAYGKMNMGNKIPPNSVLLFDIEVLAIDK